MLETVLLHPRKLWVRKALFQVHLWAGVLLSLYMVAISLSGSILVFQDEIRRAALARPPLELSRVAPISAVVARVQKQFPRGRLTFVEFPQAENPWWTVYVEDAHANRRMIYADPASGIPVEQTGRLFIDFVLDLHVYLLAGQTGFVVNCIAGSGLFVLALTGAILWWPGVKLWRRALTVSLKHRWRRVNYDLHNAVGLWTLLIVSWWGITAIYFLFPQQVASVVNVVSPVRSMKPPLPPRREPGSGIATVDAIVGALPASASEHLSGVALPGKPGDDVAVYVDRGAAGDFSHRDIFTFDGRTAKLLTVWHYGEKQSLGDWILWLMYPLHFGTVWGGGVKVLWAALGLCVSLLSVTGLLMYWNRKLSKLFKVAA